MPAYQPKAVAHPAHADFEPRQLYNLTQFIISDKEGRGIMTLEEAMQILYLRHGRANLDQHVSRS